MSLTLEGYILITSQGKTCIKIDMDKNNVFQEVSLGQIDNKVKSKKYLAMAVENENIVNVQTMKERWFTLESVVLFHLFLIFF